MRAATLPLLLIAGFLVAAPAGAATLSALTPASSGQTCEAACSGAGLQPAQMQQFNTDSPVATYVCAANVSGQGYVPGFQFKGNTTCSATWHSEVVTASDYGCLCLEGSAQLGMVAASDSSSTCEATCDQTLDGLAGSAVAPEASEALPSCVPSNEIGELNRFGHSGAPADGVSLCSSAVDGDVYTSASFSCICVFAPTASTIVQSPSDSPVTPAESLATGG